MVGILRMKEMLELKPGKVGVKMQTNTVHCTFLLMQSKTTYIVRVPSLSSSAISHLRRSRSSICLE